MCIAKANHLRNNKYHTQGVSADQILSLKETGSSGEKDIGSKATGISVYVGMQASETQNSNKLQLLKYFELNITGVSLPLVKFANSLSSHFSAFW